MSTIKIRRLGRVCLMDPFPSFLKKVLTFPIQRGEFDARTKDLSYNPEDKEFWQKNEEGPGYFYSAGFTYKVCKLLKDEGYEIDYKDLRGINLEEPDFSNLSVTLRKPQKKAIASMEASEGGLIGMGTGVGKTILLSEHCRIHPEACFVISSQETPPLRAVYQNLKTDLGDDVAGLGVVGKEAEPSRITICNAKGLHNAPLRSADVLHFDEVHGAAAEKTSEVLGEATQATMFGFSGSLRGRNDKAEPILEALFGPILYRMSHKEAVEEGYITGIDIHLYTISMGPLYYDSHWERNKFGIVRNSRRNKRVAGITRDFYGDQGNKVVIIAQDDLEHLFRLKQYLPNFSLAYGQMTEKQKSKLIGQGLIDKDYRGLYPGEHHRIAEKFREGEIRRVIATSVWDTGIDLPNLEVLVRAEASSGFIPAVQLPGRATRKGEEKEKSVVVDFFDDFGPQFSGSSKKRIANYKEIGYNIKRRNG